MAARWYQCCGRLFFYKPSITAFAFIGMGSLKFSRLVSFIALFSVSTVWGIDYFVDPAGNDSYDGRSPATPFATIQKGVDALQAGDTLIIQPGEYFGGVSREGLGSADVDTVIRARIPGTVTVRGDVPAPEFERAEGYRFVWRARVDRPVQVVNELDTLSILESAPDVDTLEFVPGRFFYDADSGSLWISTTDLNPPSDHFYTLSVDASRGGFFFVRPQRLIVDGIAFTGFHSAEVLPRLTGGNSSSDGIPHGVYLWNATNCTIRNCIAYLNAAGLSILSNGDNRVESSVSYANGSRHGGSAGNIVVFGAGADTISGCRAFLGKRNGMRFYGGGDEKPNRFESSISWHNKGACFQIKGCTGVVDGCIAPDNFVVAKNTINSLQMSRVGDNPADNNIVLDDWPNIDPASQFADPVNRDFRLQSTSVFRGAGPDGRDRGPLPYQGNVYFVAANGSDNADGLSVSTAWQTLNRALRSVRPGDTLYLTEGEYRFTRPHQFGIGADGKRVSVRARGTDVVTVRGGVEVQETSGLEFQRIHFTDRVSLVRCGDVKFDNCVFGGNEIGLKVDNSTGLRVTHSVFNNFGDAGIRIRGSNSVYLSGNLFNNTRSPAVDVDEGSFIVYSDYNSYVNGGNAWQVGGHVRDLAALAPKQDGRSIVAQPVFAGGQVANTDAFAARGPHATAIGLYREAAHQSELALAGPSIYSVSTSSANIEWVASGPTSAVVRWGEGDSLENEEAFDFHRWSSFSLTGLKPDTVYTVAIALDSQFSVIGSDEEPVDEVRVSFRTAAAPSTPRELYVSPNGSDANNGLSPASAWQTVSHAAAQARPGDTVWIGGGTYSESVRIRVTGEQDAPITFRSVPGEKVVFDGNDRTLDHAFLVANKAHLRFDGFYFKGFQGTSPIMPWSDDSGGKTSSIVIYCSSDIQVSRCFHDGRGPGYSPGLISARHSTDLLVENCVISDSMGGGINFAGCSNFLIRNNVFLRNKIQNISEGINSADQLFFLENNIFTDSLAIKVRGALFAIGRVETMREDNNCYFMRIPIEERMLFMFYGPFEQERAASGYGVSDDGSGMVITELTRMSLPQYLESFNPNSSSIAADPLFAGALGFDTASDPAEPKYVVDFLMTNPDLDFNDLFATNSEVVERGIGLQPEAFADFHFNQTQK